MALARRSLLLLVAALAASATAAATDAAGWMRPRPNSCKGTGEQFLGEHDGGFGLRRRLVYDDNNDDEGGYPTQYICYAALRRDSVPCSVPGASYYNCEPGAAANPYTRGCSAITQCRG
ncbi:unnamed protein product [Alopecurus aequalis]